MFQERTDYSPVDMELTSGASDTLRPETPRIGESVSREDHSVVRRNLMIFLCDVNAIGTPLQASTPRCVDSTSVRQNTKNEQSFVYKFISWICVFILGSAAVFELYQHFPGYMLLGLTKEYLICGALVVLCVLLFTIIVKDKLNKRSGQMRRYSSPQHDSATSQPYDKSTLLDSPVYTGNRTAQQIPVKRTYSGDGTEIWTEFIRYFENISERNSWDTDWKRRVFLTVLRGQAETFVYGLPEPVRNDWIQIKEAMDGRFGHKAMKESYMTEAKLRKKRDTESFRDFGQAIHDSYRRAYPDNRDYVQEGSVKTFLDNCSENEDFRLAVKRTRPRTLDDAVTSAMQEECIRMTENKKRDVRYPRPPVYHIPSGTRNQGDARSYQNYDRANQRSANVNEDQVKRKCYQCDSPYHVIRDCPKRNSGNKFNLKLNGRGPRQ